jgi:hypothetical protein
MCSILVSSFPNTPKTTMSDFEVLKLHEVLSSAAKTPKIILQRIEMFPALQESLVSVVCIKGFYKLLLC